MIIEAGPFRILVPGQIAYGSWGVWTAPMGREHKQRELKRFDTKEHATQWIARQVANGARLEVRR